MACTEQGAARTERENLALTGQREPLPLLSPLPSPLFLVGYFLSGFSIESSHSLIAERIGDYTFYLCPNFVCRKTKVKLTQIPQLVVAELLVKPPIQVCVTSHS